MSGQAQLGPMKSCVPPVPLIAVSLGAHIEAAAGYGPVAVYAELLVSWPWDQVSKQILRIGETGPFNFCQEFYELI